MKAELKYEHKCFRLQNVISRVELLRIDNFLCEVDINVPVGSAVQKNLLTFSKLHYTILLYLIYHSMFFNVMHSLEIGCFIIA